MLSARRNVVVNIVFLRQGRREREKVFEMRKSFIAIMVIAMMLLAGAAFATTYYVATDGDNANDGLTAQTAWLDINYGDRAQILQPGDVVLVQPGTYEGSTISGDNPAFGYEFSKCSGTEGNPITYKANGEVIIDNATATTDSVHTKDLTIHADYVVVEGFKLTGDGKGVNGN